MAKSIHRKQEYISRVFTLGDIDTDSACRLIGSIYEVNREDKNKNEDKREPIQLIINSYGGELYSGLAIVDVIDASITPIHTICHGSAMSMALVVFAAGHHRIASKYATFMYHEASFNIDGKVLHHKQELKETERTDKICDEYFLSKTKFTTKQLKDIRDKRSEWYFDVKLAYKYGLVDEII